MQSIAPAKQVPLNQWGFACIPTPPESRPPDSHFKVAGPEYSAVTNIPIVQGTVGLRLDDMAACMHRSLLILRFRQW